MKTIVTLKQIEKNFGKRFTIDLLPSITSENHTGYLPLKDVLKKCENITNPNLIKLILSNKRNNEKELLLMIEDMFGSIWNILHALYDKHDPQENRIIDKFYDVFEAGNAAHAHASEDAKFKNMLSLQDKLPHVTNDNLFKHLQIALHLYLVPSKEIPNNFTSIYANLITFITKITFDKKSFIQFYQ